jgi:hypothetical protein
MSAFQEVSGYICLHTKYCIFFNIPLSYAGIDKDIPRSLLLGFHPDYFLTDLPITPRIRRRRALPLLEDISTACISGNIHLLS